MRVTQGLGVNHKRCISKTFQLHFCEEEELFFLVKVVSDLKFGHFYFFGPPLTSATSEIGWKTSNFNVDFNVEKREEFGVPL